MITEFKVRTGQVSGRYEDGVIEFDGWRIWIHRSHMGDELCLDPRQSRILERRTKAYSRRGDWGRRRSQQNPAIASDQLCINREAGLRKEAEPRVNHHRVDLSEDRGAESLERI